MDSIWYFEEVNLFEHFCPIKKSIDDYEQLTKRAYKKGEHIYLTNDDADKVFFIQEGSVTRMDYSDDGKELVKGLVHEGEIFGELAIFGEEQRRDFAVAVENTEICVQDRDQVADLMTLCFIDRTVDQLFPHTIGRAMLSALKMLY